jgi:hypothetical protein
VQSQRLRRPFEGGDGAVVRVAVGAATERRHQPSPLLPVRPDGTGHPRSRSRDRGKPGPSLPVGEQFGGRHRPPDERQHLAVEVLEDDRGVEHVGCGSDDFVDRGAPHAEGGERLVHAAGVVDLGVLLGHDPPVHLLGDLDEAHGMVQCDDGKLEV